jgi:formate hydrogenlyase subunit 4
MTLAFAIFAYLISLLLAPSLPGVINRIKALFAGRKGQPILQTYYDLFKLLRKNLVYSKSSTWIVAWGSWISLSALLIAGTLMPFFSFASILHFHGDIILFAYLLALARLFIVLSALDTGSSFEGMGANRELMFSMLAEPALFIILATLVRQTGALSLDTIFRSATGMPSFLAPETALLVISLFLILLVENSRMPFDDPNTHLELTMIHEVMVLDHGGPDFAVITFAASLKLWLFAGFVVNLLFPPVVISAWLKPFLHIGLVYGVGVIVGITESTAARVRLTQIPQLLFGAAVFALLAFIIAR